MSEGGPRSIIVGTAGHVDHGKSSLVRVLTGTDPDRLAEEKRRGLTIELGFARLDTGGSPEIGIVDVPGHEDFMHTMLAGASGIDLLLLVIAADEGPMPQTLEHMDVADLLGIRNGVVALSKSDRVEEDWLELASEAVLQELDRFGLADRWSIVPVSAVTGEGIETLREALITAASDVSGRPDDDMFRLPVDRAFSIAGAGTVVTGSVWSGKIRRGDTVWLLPSGDRARVRGVQEFGRERDSARPGARCALALSGLPLDRVRRGHMVVMDPAWRPVRRFGAHVRILPRADESLDHADTVRLYHGTSETIARVLLASGDALGPGDSGQAVLVTRDPLPLRARDRFVLRRVSPMRTIGGGVVADLHPGRRWRQCAGDWNLVTGGDARTALAAAARLTAGRGLDRTEIPLRTGFPAQSGFDSEAAEEIGDRLFSPGIVEHAREQVLLTILAGHREAPRRSGVSLETVRAGLSDRFAAVLLDSVLRDLESEGVLVRDGPEIRHREHSVRLTGEEESARSLLLRAIEEGGLAPPPPDQLAIRPGLDRSLLNDLLHILIGEGRVVAVGPDLILSAESIERLRSSAIKVLRQGSPASPSAFAAEFGLSRRELIPLLEYLDRIGVTERTGEGRVAGPAGPRPGPSEHH